MDHENEWVALTPDRKKVIASGKTLEEVDIKLKEKKQKNIILHFVPPFDGTIAPHSIG